MARTNEEQLLIDSAIKSVKENPLDRERWYTLGKARGWNDDTNIAKIFGDPEPKKDELIMYHWHRYIDFLAEGKEDKFWEELK